MAQTLAVLRYNRRMSKDTNPQVKVTESKDGSVKLRSQRRAPRRYGAARAAGRGRA